MPTPQRVVLPTRLPLRFLVIVRIGQRPELLLRRPRGLEFSHYSSQPRVPRQLPENLLPQFRRHPAIRNPLPQRRPHPRRRQRRQRQRIQPKSNSPV